MNLHSGFFAIALLAGLATAGHAQPAQPAAAGFGPTGPIVKVADGFTFLEGPVAADEGTLYFNDVREKKTWKLEAGGKVSVFREPTQGANGMMINAQGELVCCEMSAGVLDAVDLKTGAVRVLADRYEGKPLNSTNDLSIDRTGGIYFTDPSFGRQGALPQGVRGVYYLPAEGPLRRVVEDLENPNGLILSPDETTLYVDATGAAEVMAYPVTAPGQLGEGRVFARLATPPGQTASGADGVTVDTQGNLYVTTSLGVQILSPAGVALGTIEFPEKPANCTFGGQGFKTLYVTARTGLYAVPMPIAGHRPPATP